MKRYISFNDRDAYRLLLVLREAQYGAKASGSRVVTRLADLCRKKLEKAERRKR